MDQNKATPPVELSVKYMAWNIKQMDANLKRIADAVEMIMQDMRASRHYVSKDSAPLKQMDLPF